MELRVASDMSGHVAGDFQLPGRAQEQKLSCKQQMLILANLRAEFTGCLWGHSWEA